MLILQYRRACEVPDVDGYLPLHYCLDGDHCSPAIAKLLIDAYPVGVSKPTNDGHLPLHCILNNDEPDLALVGRLIELYPQGVQHIAVDLVPVLDGADPATWTGDMKEKRWTPLSRAIEKGLRNVIKLLQSALPKSVDDAALVAQSPIPESRGKTPLSGMRAVRPLPTGFLPPSLRQAAHVARSISTTGRRRGSESPNSPGQGFGGTERTDGDAVIEFGDKSPHPSVPSPAIYFKSREDRPGTAEEKSPDGRSIDGFAPDGEGEHGKIEIVVQKDEDANNDNGPGPPVGRTGSRLLEEAE